jgi:transposase-like protein
MFCPACGDCRETAKAIKDKWDTFRCHICGHVFYYEHRQRLEKRMGDGSHDYTFDYAKTGAEWHSADNNK